MPNKHTKRIIHISHTDLDGFSATILTELIINHYPENMFSLELVNITPNMLCKTIKRILNEIDNYDLVIITDLAFTETVAELIQNSGHADMFRAFDHHEIKFDVSKYSWLKINKYIDGNYYEDQKGHPQTCGTRLYYDFIKQDRVMDVNILQLPSMTSLNAFIEAVRMYDTYEFKDPDLLISTAAYDAPRLNTLFHMMGHDNFKQYIEDYIYNPVEMPVLQMTTSTSMYPWVSKLIELEDRRNNLYVEAALRKLTYTKFKKEFHIDGKFVAVDYNIGIVFAERNGPMIGEAIRDNPDINIDLCAIVTNNRVSFYACKDGVDVAELASYLKGGGHKNASGFSIPYVESNYINVSHFMAIVNSAISSSDINIYNKPGYKPNMKPGFKKYK